MATKSTKKSTATTAKKRPVAKTTSTATRAAKAKKTATPSRTKKTVKKNSDYQSFQVNESREPFISFRPSIQTIYWLILSIVVFLFGWYIITITQSIDDIYNQIDEIRLTEESIVLEPNANEQ